MRHRYHTCPLSIKDKLKSFSISICFSSVERYIDQAFTGSCIGHVGNFLRIKLSRIMFNFPPSSLTSEDKVTHDYVQNIKEKRSSFLELFLGIIIDTHFLFSCCIKMLIWKS